MVNHRDFPLSISAKARSLRLHTSIMRRWRLKRKDAERLYGKGTAPVLSKPFALRLSRYVNP